MEFISSTGLVGVALLNAACVLNAGFRSFQALQRRSAVGKGGAKVASVVDAHLPRVPALPQLSSSDEDGEEAEREDGFVELDSSSSVSTTPRASTLDGILHWLYYWSAFAAVRFLQIHVLDQFSYLQLMINVAVLFSPAGDRLSKALFDIGIVPVMDAVSDNVAPHAMRGAIFFHSSFSQCVRGVHTEVAKISIPYASEDQLLEIENHCTKMESMLQTERRRRRLAEWSESQLSFANDGGNGPSTANRDVVSASGGLRRRKTKSRTRPKGIRQSLGLW